MLILDPFEAIITQNIIEGMLLKDILKIITEQGYEGKTTNFYTYCKKLMEDKDIDYRTRTNIAGKPINRTKLNLHYIHKKEVLTYLWSDQKLSVQDKGYIFDKYPFLKELYECIKEFKKVFQNKCLNDLRNYLDKYQTSSIKKVNIFIKGLYKDLEAVEQAVSSPLSNGYVEGNNSRLKMVKRVMYGRAGLESL